HSVTVIDNLILGSLNNIKHLLDNPNFTFYQEDILKSSSLELIFKNHNFDMVYHLAANSDIQKGSNDPDVDYSLTFKTTYNILMCMKKYNVNKLFFSSTSAIYGESTDLLHENYGPLIPVSNYGASKLASEAFISAFSSTYKIKTWIARFPNVVGERFTHGVIYDFVKRLRENSNELVVLGNGEQIKPYLYVKDLVNGIIFICNNSNNMYNVYNIGVSSRTKVKDIANMVIQEMGLKAKIIYTGGDRGWVGDVTEFQYDLTKINSLGWSASRTSNEAVNIAIKRALNI
ncbi:NAD-dependent epimerase/dehydratase family protein, partial [Flavobacteriaceae bacterium]|nr:NAD-dependent epimerase/dehydratase family protein [Flavobacteriaceae bacterium]